MAKTRRLDGERLRELARIGAEVTLRRLRAEIVAIERAFPELKASGPTPAGPPRAAEGVDENPCHVRRSAPGSLRADEALLAERRKAQAKIK
jgi:hypothetical protein